MFNYKLGDLSKTLTAFEPTIYKIVLNDRYLIVNDNLRNYRRSLQYEYELLDKAVKEYISRLHVLK